MQNRCTYIKRVGVIGCVTEVVGSPVSGIQAYTPAVAKQPTCKGSDESETVGPGYPV